MTTTVTAQQPTDSKPAPKKQAYRKDLDGLRGIAIGLVVLFHVFVGRVSGGVDVFLLLSGSPGVVVTAVVVVACISAVAVAAVLAVLEHHCKRLLKS